MVTVETTKGRIRRLETQTSSAQPAAKAKEKPMVLGIYFTLPHAPQPKFPYRLPRPRSGNATNKTLSTVSESVLLGKMESKPDDAESGGQEKQNETMQKVSHTYPDGRLPNPAACPTSPTSSSSPGPVHSMLPSLSTPCPRPHCESGRRPPTPTPASCTRRGALSSSVFPGAIMRTPLGELMGMSLKLWV